MRTVSCLALLALAGCEMLPDTDHWDSGFEAFPGAPAAVAGVWTLEGEGSRSDCSDDLYDVDRFLMSARPLEIEQDGSRLTLATAIPGFELYDGEVSGEEVGFRTREQTRLGEIGFDFTGTVQGSRHISGSFTGRGPVGCRASGTFTVFIDRPGDDDGDGDDGEAV